MEIQKNVSLKSLTTFQVGGEAEFFAEISNVSDLRGAIAFAKERHLTIRILGGGSNVLVPEGLIGGLTLQIDIRGYETIDEGSVVRVRAAAGESFDEVVARTVRDGLWGLENLSGIPGSVGATPIQNVGAYGVEVSLLIDAVRIFDMERESERVLSKDECAFAYRHSLFKEQAGKQFVVLGVDFLLTCAPQPKLSYKDLAQHFSGIDSPATCRDIRAAVLGIRSKKFPDWRKEGTAGSFFKNPVVKARFFETLQKRYPEMPGFITQSGDVKIPLGWVIDHVCGMRGMREGNVGTFPAQALVIVNYGNATSAEIDVFADRIASAVKQHTGIEIEREVTMF